MPLKQINTNLATKVVKNYRICKKKHAFFSLGFRGRPTGYSLEAWQ